MSYHPQQRGGQVQMPEPEPYSHQDHGEDLGYSPSAMREGNPLATQSSAIQPTSSMSSPADAPGGTQNSHPDRTRAQPDSTNCYPGDASHKHGQKPGESETQDGCCCIIC